MPNLKEKKKDREPRFGIISFPDLNPLRGREEARDAAVGQTAGAEAGSPDGSDLLDRWSQLRDTVAETAQLHPAIEGRPIGHRKGRLLVVIENCADR